MGTTRTNRYTLLEQDMYNKTQIISNVSDYITSTELANMSDMVTNGAYLLAAILAILAITNILRNNMQARKYNAIVNESEPEVFAMPEDEDNDLDVGSLTLVIPEQIMDDSGYDTRTQSEYAMDNGQYDVEVYWGDEYDSRLDNVVLPQSKLESRGFQYLGLRATRDIQSKALMAAAMVLSVVLPAATFIDDVLGAPARIKSLEAEVAELRKMQVKAETDENVRAAYSEWLAQYDATDAPDHNLQAI